MNVSELLFEFSWGTTTDWTGISRGTEWRFTYYPTESFGALMDRTGFVSDFATLEDARTWLEHLGYRIEKVES